MPDRSRFVWWYGRDEAPAETVPLRAGPLDAVLDGIDLRYVRLGGVEVARRLYVAVRDQNWDTIPGMVTNLGREIEADRFTISFEVAHRLHAVDFAWKGRIVGTPEGTIRYEMEGRCGGDFRYNRIGFCLLHPPVESAGRPFTGGTPGGPIAGTLPQLIGPQRIENGTILALFPAVEWLELELAGALRARFVFEGDLFEMEDQRNWTDASYKTYCTPLALPWPKDAHMGERLAQAVAISAEAPASSQTRGDATPSPVAVQLGPALGRTLPPIGLGMASHGLGLTERERALLRTLRPAHLRADLALDQPGYPAALNLAVVAATSLGCALELAIFLGAQAEAELDDLAARLDGHAAIARVLVFRRGESVTAGRWVRLARERLRVVAPDAAFVGGTDVYFTDLNRNRPEIEALDAVVYSINPQVHAFDETSLVETVAAQADTVRSTRAFCGDVPILVGPVTLKPRFNPNATGPEPAPGPGELPAAVDTRQMSLFGAAWTLGSAKYLAESGAAALTYFETTGWRGVMETAVGVPDSLPFPSHRGTVFPLYHVLADLCSWQGARLLECRSADPLRVEALAVQADDGLHLLLANMTSSEQSVILSPLPDAILAVRTLDEHSAADACEAPERFRASSILLKAPGGVLSLDMAPYAVLRLDLDLAEPGPSH